MRHTVLLFVFGGVAAFLSAYLAPRDMPALERALVIAALFGGAAALAYVVDRLVPRPD